MCGICGTINFPDDNVCARMNSRMIHRGPDDSGKWRDGAACLGHTRLAIIDTSSAGRQPMSNEDGSIHIVHNGEIYNFQSLKKGLAESGHRFISDTDTEAIIHLYEERGEKCLDLLRGMFAFAVWDSRSKRLFAARDRFGIKPLYYCLKGEKLIFSSELKAILSSGAVENKIDLSAAEGYFNYGCVQSPGTLIEGISLLEPAHYIIFEGGRLTRARYWQPPRPASIAGKIKEEERADEIRSALDEAVRIRMIGDVPVAAFLSGGIDSSAVAALMQKNSPKPVKTFSVVFGEKRYDERKFSDRVAEMLGTDHRRILLEGEKAMKAIPAVFDAMDEPSIDGFNTFIISRAVKDEGIKVALSGLGGDELFAGYPSFRRLPRMAAVLKFSGRIPQDIRGGLFKILRPIANSRRNLKLYYSLCGSGSIDELYSTQRAVFLPPEAKEILRSISAMSKWRALIARPSPADSVNQLSLLELNNYLRNMLLRDTDRMSMANSLEVRVPFLDHLLVEKALRIPGSVKVGGRYPKRLLASAMRGLLPDEIYNRRKMGFVLPFESWIKDGLRDYFDSIFSAGSLNEVGVLDKEIVSRIWNGYLNGSRLYNYSSILCLASFINWHRRNIS